MFCSVTIRFGLFIYIICTGTDLRVVKWINRIVAEIHIDILCIVESGLCGTENSMRGFSVEMNGLVLPVVIMVYIMV